VEGEAPAEPPNQLPTRKRPVHTVVIAPHRPTIVLVTVCTKGREPWLASSDVHSLLRDVWRDSTSWLVGRYVLMPDHLHLFAAPGDDDLPLGNWVRYWKSMFSKRHGDRGHRWQSGYWDTTLRKGESYDAKWAYVRENPRRHGLVDDADEWQLQGEISELVW
jgi:putative transposase